MWCPIHLTWFISWPIQSSHWLQLSICFLIRKTYWGWVRNWFIRSLKRKSQLHLFVLHGRQKCLPAIHHRQFTWFIDCWNCLLDRNASAEDSICSYDRLYCWSDQHYSRVRSIFRAIPVGIILFIVNPVYCLEFALFILILQQVDGNVIKPIILGDKMGISGFWILFSVSIGGSLFGIAGMLWEFQYLLWFMKESRI